MVIAEWNINTHLGNHIDMMIKKIENQEKISSKDRSDLIHLIGRVAWYAPRYKTYNTLRSFCAGLINFAKIGKIKTILKSNAVNVQMGFILDLLSIVESSGSKEDLEEKLSKVEDQKYGITVSDAAVNLSSLLTNLQAALKSAKVAV